MTLRQPRVILTDVDGTTSDPSYFGSTVIPFIQKNVKPFIEKTAREKETLDVIDMLIQESRSSNYRIDGGGSIEDIAQSVKDYVNGQIRRREGFSEGVLSIILLIMMYGSYRGILKGHFYSDVSAAFYFWKQNGLDSLKINVISSGMSEVVKLLFLYGEDGNVDTFISEYFSIDDVGSKKEMRTFEKLAEILKISPRDALFLTDDPREAGAAKDARWTSVLVAREGKTFSAQDERDADAVITAFSQLTFN